MRLLAHLHVADDVLQHHDRVVHDKADREDQRHHRQVVEAVVEQVHHGERADDRERQRQAGDERRRDVAQEQEDHHHDQCDRASSSVNSTSCTESRIDSSPIEEDVELDRLAESARAMPAAAP